MRARVTDCHTRAEIRVLVVGTAPIRCRKDSLNEWMREIGIVKTLDVHGGNSLGRQGVRWNTLDMQKKDSRKEGPRWPGSQMQERLRVEPARPQKQSGNLERMS